MYQQSAIKTAVRSLKILICNSEWQSNGCRTPCVPFSAISPYKNKACNDMQCKGFLYKENSFVKKRVEYVE